MTHYFSEHQDSPLKIYEIEMNIFDDLFTIASASGIFSAKKLDKGSALLIKSAIVEDGWNVLDLGCGYGPVGISLARKYANIKITMGDINKRAIKMSKQNIKNHKLDNAKAIHSDKFDKIEGKFDTILLNPPHTAGKQVCLDMIEQSKDYLKKGGTLQIVARHNKGGKSLSAKMEEVFGNVRDIAKKSGFRVYVSSLD